MNAAPTLDIGRGQGPQRQGDLRESQVGQMPRFERLNPRVERGHCGQAYYQLSRSVRYRACLPLRCSSSLMEDWMRILRMSIVPVLVVLTAFPSFAAAEQRHAVAPAALAAAVANHSAKQDAARPSIHQALSRPEVIEIAART